MKKQGFSLIECIVALALFSILVIAMLPVMGMALKQYQALESQRKENEFLQNIVACIEADSAFTHQGIIYDFQQSNETRIPFEKTTYSISRTEETDKTVYFIENEGEQLLEIPIYKERIHTP